MSIGNSFSIPVAGGSASANAFLVFPFIEIGVEHVFPWDGAEGADALVG
jgi:hypothetical protein